jgi:hypothetical protein
MNIKPIGSPAADERTMALIEEVVHGPDPLGEQEANDQV